MAAPVIAAGAAAGAGGAAGGGAAGGAGAGGGAGATGAGAGAAGGGASAQQPSQAGASVDLQSVRDLPLDWAPQGRQQEEDDDDGVDLGPWAVGILGVVGLVLMLVLLTVMPLLLIAGVAGGAAAEAEETTELPTDYHPLLGIPAGAVPFWEMYVDAAKVYGVNPYLLMAVHEDESRYSNAKLRGVTNYLNFDGCCAGPMQFMIEPDSALNTIGGRGKTWGGYAEAYKKATIRRPARYPGKYAPHPNVYDSFDAIYAAAAYFADLGAGPQLDERTLNALRHYKGTPPGSEPYAQRDYARALELQQQSEVRGSLLERIIEYANRIDAMTESGRIPYCWAGGHGPKPGPSYIYKNCWREGMQHLGRNFSGVGLDCSGSVRWLLYLTGYPDLGPLHSSQFAYAYPRGKGRYVTIWSNNGHVFITINGRDWGTSSANYARGPGWAPHSKAGFTPTHPPGL